MAEIRSYNPNQLDADQWRQLQSLQREAFKSSLVHRSGKEIDALVVWEDPAYYHRSHLNPNEVDRYAQGQSHTHPRVAVAFEQGEPAGFAYSTHNVSGRFQGLKRLSVVKNYLWMREIAVEPVYQRRGIATHLAASLAIHASLPPGIQPVSAYVWPDEDGSYMQRHLQTLGFEPTDEDHRDVFNTGTKDTRQVRMQAPHAYGVWRALERRKATGR